MTALREEAVGFCFTPDDVIGWVAQDAATLADRVAHRELLGLPTADGTAIFPSWQFGGAGIPMAHLREVLDALAEYEDDPWAWALWLRWRYPQTPIGALSVMSWLAIGGDPGLILELAHADAGGWGSLADIAARIHDLAG